VVAREGDPLRKERWSPLLSTRIRVIRRAQQPGESYGTTIDRLIAQFLGVADNVQAAYGPNLVREHETWAMTIRPRRCADADGAPGHA